MKIELSEWKWKTKALYVEKTDKGLLCTLCPNVCLIKDNYHGICKSRYLYNNWIYAINYGSLCSQSIDPIEKKPLYHFLPTSTAFSIATAGCNLTCKNCQNAQISQVSPFDIQHYDLTPEKIVDAALKSHCQSIAYTYTEPTIYFEFMLATAQLARQHGLKNIFISNGYINREPLQELMPFLDAANIDLKCQSNTTYQRLCDGKLPPVLSTIKALKRENVWLEITNLLIPGITDDTSMITRMCDWMYQAGLQTTPLHFNRFYPAHQLMDIPPTPLETMQKAFEIAIFAGIQHVYLGNVPQSNFSNTYCPDCKGILVERNGYDVKMHNFLEGRCGSCGEEVAGVWS